MATISAQVSIYPLRRRSIGKPIERTVHAFRSHEVELNTAPMSTVLVGEETEVGWVAKSDGWFVLHTSRAPWFESDRFGVVCDFEGDAPFGQIGVNIHIINPGQPSCLYHRENAQENFYVLTGRCILVVEGEERQLEAGHFVHCPPWTNHVFVGAGEEPCAILMIGHRPTDHRLVYPVSREAAKHNASVEEETTSVVEAYGEVRVFGQPGHPLWPL